MVVVAGGGVEVVLVVEVEVEVVVGCFVVVVVVDELLEVGIAAPPQALTIKKEAHQLLCLEKNPC